MHDPARSLGVFLLLALRIGPTWIALGFLLEAPWLGALLALGSALSVLPLALPLAAPSLQPIAAAPLELLRGSLLALGSLAPLLAFGWAGRFSEAFSFVSASRSLARIYSLAALAVLFASGAHLVVLRALLGTLSELPLGGSSADLSSSR